MSSFASPSSALPRWASEIVQHPPASGEGFHSWLFSAASALWRCGWGIFDIENFLRSQSAGCGRRVTEREIADAVKNSKQEGFKPAPRGQWPALNKSRRDEITGSGRTLADLWEASPRTFGEGNDSAEEIMPLLFPEEPLLCLAKKSAAGAVTRPFSEWRGQFGAHALIVPSPMTAPTGVNKAGEKTNRCFENTGPRKYLVIEFDEGTVDEQAALLLYLAREAPMVLAISSGGKSLHGWFPTRGRPDEQLRPFMNLAVSLGADPATWVRCQMVRLPCGTRENGKEQAIYYFNDRILA